MKQHSRCPWTGTEAEGEGGGTLLSGAGCGGAGTAAPPPREAGTCLPAQHRLFPPMVSPAPRGPGGAGLGPPSHSPSGVGRRGGAAACGSGRWPSAGEDAEAEQAVRAALLPPAEPRGWG